MAMPEMGISRDVMLRFSLAAVVFTLGCESADTHRVSGPRAVTSSVSIVSSAAPTNIDPFIGVIVGRFTADLTPRFDGKIREVHVRLGDRVKKDDLIATLDLPTVQSELRMAQVGLRTVDIERERTAVELEAAEEQLTRRLALEKESLATAEDVTAARYRRELAAMRLEASRATSTERRAKIEQLRKDAATGELRAPFEGLISVRYVDPGASVTAATRIVRLISGDDLLVRFAVPESNVHRLSPGIAVRVFVGDQNRVLSGVIEKIAPEVDTASRMLVVEAALDRSKSSGVVMAGLMARVTLAE